MTPPVKEIMGHYQGCSQRNTSTTDKFSKYMSKSKYLSMEIIDTNNIKIDLTNRVKPCYYFVHRQLTDQTNSEVVKGFAIQSDGIGFKSR